MIGVHLNEQVLALSLDGSESRVLPVRHSRIVSRVNDLREQWLAVGLPQAPFCAAVNALDDVENLGKLLADCQKVDLQPAGFFDSAALAAAALGLPGTGIVLELQAQTAVVTRVVAAEGRYRRAAFKHAEGCGGLDLRRACLQRIADTMIRLTRFDPLHDLRDEQYLQQNLQMWLQAVIEDGVTRVQMTALDKPLEVSLSLEDFAKATEPVFRTLRRLLLDCRTPGAECYFLIPEAIMGIPGASTMLAGLGQLPVFLLPDGLVAKAAAHCAPRAADGDGVMLSRQVAIDPLESPKRLTAVAAGAYQRPTHLLFETRVWALGGALPIGRSPASKVVLPAGIAGVSREHCTLINEGAECVLIDHSRYGTWVNEELVRGRQRVAAGDRIRLGDPGVELSLIAVGEEHGQASR